MDPIAHGAGPESCSLAQEACGQFAMLKMVCFDVVGIHPNPFKGVEPKIMEKVLNENLLDLVLLAEEEDLLH